MTEAATGAVYGGRFPIGAVAFSYREQEGKEIRVLPHLILRVVVCAGEYTPYMVL